MNIDELIQLIPLLLLGIAIVTLLLSIAFFRNHTLSVSITIAALLASLLGLMGPFRSGTSTVTSLLCFDHYAVFFIGTFLVSCIFIAGISYRYLSLTEKSEEYYVLLLTATLGAIVLAASTHLVSFFLGLEILSISLYALIFYPDMNSGNLEASLKYVVLAGVSSAILLFGMALTYDSSGTMEFGKIVMNFGAPGRDQVLLWTGIVLILAGASFKLALVPFHMWAPDVYQGAPAPVSAYIATISKGAVFAVFLRFFLMGGPELRSQGVMILSSLAIVSMMFGNLLALLQKNIKRLLAYSSTAHLGYLLVALIAGGRNGAQAVMFYLVVYMAATLAAFGVVTVLSRPDREADDLECYQGLFWRKPAMALVLSSALLSLAGIPLTAGFTAKFYLVSAGVGSHLWLLVILLALNSAIGLFYYLRFILAMVREPDIDTSKISWPPLQALSRVDGTVLTVLIVAIVGIGIYPAPLIGVVQAAMKNLVP